jgi:hypothetical protein
VKLRVPPGTLPPVTDTVCEFPEQISVDEGVTVRAVGEPLTVTFTTAGAEVQLRRVDVKEYDPPALIPAFVIVVFCDVEENPLGPDHEYTVPVPGEPLRDSVCPLQMKVVVELADTVGVEFTVTVTSFEMPVKEVLQVVLSTT